ncbi:hypothetical protein G3578_14760 [Brevibacillus sp. SYP-B805]|uniref:hypothetical protein n=1 Tax=Brevibacillus sp. SYP-B805 TaxID=1578199 RepID=UPI0013ECBD35|nr:hypothetical protein [Brevibacillus sp. SYP-B805]NGQ96422.1 hypothetical protein [Brevibacillus sp. SYP-B805]
MTKVISVLALIVIVVPMSYVLLLDGPDSILGACTRFFNKLFAEAIRFGTN